MASFLTLMKGKSLVAFLVSLLVTPLIYLLAFNDFFHTGIPYTVDSWFLAFLVGILASVVFLLLFIGILVFAIKAFGGVGFILAFVTLAALPVFYILSFNFILSTSVPLTFDSYVFVGVVQIATIFVSWLLGAVFGGRK